MQALTFSDKEIFSIISTNLYHSSREQWVIILSGYLFHTYSRSTWCSKAAAKGALRQTLRDRVWQQTVVKFQALGFPRDSYMNSKTYQHAFDSFVKQLEETGVLEFKKININEKN